MRIDVIDLVMRRLAHLKEKRRDDLRNRISQVSQWLIASGRLDKNPGGVTRIVKPKPRRPRPGA